ncbi:phospholipase B-like protein [Heterostelium album PN500]|uniref:Phospholipase B-like n=1 Tax=Heterostelium pallidum (strain ATCC 26659 / Pp 5 / PN500) TaxID=670386 RepID=D3B1B3_HETP5|nr:phospholipase B-like protein [Heterostelium album PN500]EFA85087.1 phospholipase B-like protein [Heterostelium album PN500]|eukprot:XP_020437196.1 phospholipase B-like protein [Heterostelium album PN500]
MINKGLWIFITSTLLMVTVFSQDYPTVSVDKNVFLQSSVSVNVIFYQNSYTLQLASSAIPSGGVVVASGTYIDDIPNNGWGNLTITTLPYISDLNQAYIGGFIEGVITAERIYQMWTNYAANEFVNSTPSSTLISYMSSQLQWVRQSISEPHDDNPYPMNEEGTINATVYWHTAGLLMGQFDGMVAGYAAVPAMVPITAMQLYLLSSAGDLQTLNSLYGNPGVNAKVSPFLWGNDKGADAIDFLDCSALVRIIPNSQDVYFGHTTWRYYYGMMRIFKTYQFEFQEYGNPYVAAFSSSPGFLSSKDDFYVTGHQLAVMETTNEIFNDTLYSFVIPESFLVWQRAVVSNILATNAQSWVQVFQQYNSGTYNNQWMVFDYKLFKSGSTLPPNTFWILEQIPGYCELADVTPELNKNGFWPSYNIPYFPYIYNISGYNEQLAKYGNSYSYEQCPRAQIFNRNSSSINTYEQFQAMMQFNNYVSDPLSQGSPMNAISSRADLLATGKQKAFGGVDSKITSSKQIPTLGATCISGPTHQGLPPFRFSANPVLNATSHIGLPDLWDFDWVDFN